MSHFYNPSSGVKSEGFLGVDVRICGYQGIPRTMPPPIEKQHYIQSSVGGLDGGVMVSDGSCIFDGLGLHEFVDDVMSGKSTDSGVVFGHTHLGHIDEIALEMAAVDEPEQFRTGVPAVNKKVVKANAFRDGPAYYSDDVYYLALHHFGLSDIHFLDISTFLCVLCGPLLFGKALWLVLVLANLCLYGAIKHELRPAVRVADEHSLEFENALHSGMGKHLSEPLGFIPRLGRSVSSIMRQRTASLASVLRLILPIS